MCIAGKYRRGCQAVQAKSQSKSARKIPSSAIIIGPFETHPWRRKYCFLPINQDEWLPTKFAYLIFQPQHGIPDLFIWLISGNKRLAYQRIPARNILFSMQEEEKGKDCGSLQTLFLKVPAKNNLSSWTNSFLGSFFYFYQKKLYGAGQVFFLLLHTFFWDLFCTLESFAKKKNCVLHFYPTTKNHLLSSSISAFLKP